MLGKHTIKTWSSTQTTISLSSGEAEFNGVVKGSGAGLGYRSLMKDLGHDVDVRLWTDSSAALGICSRQGLGKLRHIDTHTLWVQQAVRCGSIDLRKIPGEANPADIFTEHSLTREKLIELTGLFSSEFRGGRAASAAQTRTTPSQKIRMADVDDLDVNELQDHRGDEGIKTIMPHNCYGQDELNLMYPSVAVPEAVDSGDPQAEIVDPLIERGLEEAKRIMKEAEQSGRRRRMPAMGEQPGCSEEALLVEELYTAEDKHLTGEEPVDDMSSHVKLDKQDVGATATRVDAPTRHFESVPVSYSFAFPVLSSDKADHARSRSKRPATADAGHGGAARLLRGSSPGGGAIHR